MVQDGNFYYFESFRRDQHHNILHFQVSFAALFLKSSLKLLPSALCLRLVESGIVNTAEHLNADHKFSLIVLILSKAERPYINIVCKPVEIPCPAMHCKYGTFFWSCSCETFFGQPPHLTSTFHRRTVSSDTTAWQEGRRRSRVYSSCSLL